MEDNMVKHLTRMIQYVHYLYEKSFYKQDIFIGREVVQPLAIL